MPNSFDYTNLAVKMVCPDNVVIVDDKDLPGIYVTRTSKTLAELMNTEDASIHPAFRFSDGTTKSVLNIGKYQGMVNGSRLYSLPCEDPANNTPMDTIIQYCRNKGAGHHMITGAEWAFLALLAKKNGTQPKGNNDYGKDASETTRVAIQTSTTSGKTARVATGTGPLSWSDTGEINGIWDLNGNVWEAIGDLRLVEGELQVIPFNDAAKNDTDISLTSTAWRGINGEATDWDDLFIPPEKLVDASGSAVANSSYENGATIKLDYIDNHWQWKKTEITSKSDSSRNAAFVSTTIAADVSDFTALYLRAMALAPEAGDSDYGGDIFYANNGAAQRGAFRGGGYCSGAGAGVFALILSNPRAYSNDNRGFRAAFENL